MTKVCVAGSSFPAGRADDRGARAVSGLWQLQLKARTQFHMAQGALGYGSGHQVPGA